MSKACCVLIKRKMVNVECSHKHGATKNELIYILTLLFFQSYLFVMGKLNVPKMANFMEVDVFVLVACPENTLIDSQV